MRCGPKVLFIAVLICHPVLFAQAGNMTNPNQTLFAPYWIAQEGWHTELQLRNNDPANPLTVTPILHDASGNAMTLDAVTIPGNELRAVDVNAAVSKIANSLSPLYGYIELRYTAPAFHALLLP